MAIYKNRNHIYFGRLEERETDFLPPLPSALERHVRLVKDGDTLGVQVRQDDLHFLKRDFIPTILDT